MDVHGIVYVSFSMGLQCCWCLIDLDFWCMVPNQFVSVSICFLQIQCRFLHAYQGRKKKSVLETIRQNSLLLFLKTWENGTLRTENDKTWNTKVYKVICTVCIAHFTDSHLPQQLHGSADHPDSALGRDTWMVVFFPRATSGTRCEFLGTATMVDAECISTLGSQ